MPDLQTLRTNRAARRLRNRPPRYQTAWGAEFHEEIKQRLHAGIAVLDVGSGRAPTLPPDSRPAGSYYVGLDPSATELQAAAPGAYNETIVADIATPQAALLNRFDLVVSWQVLEHVADVPNALENIRSYLRPGGTMVIMFSGRWSLFAIAGRAIPFSLGKPIVSRIMKRSPTLGPVFPAHYDQCYDSALRRLLEAWGTSEIHPYFRGAAYLNFSAITFACYLRYENVVATRRVANLATHYLVVAEKQ